MLSLRDWLIDLSENYRVDVVDGEVVLEEFDE